MSQKTTRWAARAADSQAKFHLVTDGTGVPLNVELSAGQTHDSTCFESAIDGICVPQPLGRPRTRPKRLAGDKAYRCRRIRDWLFDHGITAAIPRKDNLFMMVEPLHGWAMNQNCAVASNPGMTIATNEPK
jgi:hypothetical protein